MHQRKVPAVPVAATPSRPVQLRDYEQAEGSHKRNFDPIGYGGEFPAAKLTSKSGVQLALSPCGKCGGRQVKICCPLQWPIFSVALTCFMCGSVVDYLDDLLLLPIKEAIGVYQKRQYVSRSSGRRSGVTREAKLLSSDANYKVIRELIYMGFDGDMTPVEIAAELGVKAEYVVYILSTRR